MAVFSESEDKEPLPIPISSPSSVERPSYILWLTVIPVLYLLVVQSGLLVPHRSWRWDGRDFHDDDGTLAQFHVSSIPATEHLYALAPSASSPSATITTNSTLRATSPPPQLEIVISYYNEPLDGVADLIRRAYAELPHWSKKTTIYHKGVKFGDEGVSEQQIAKELQAFVEDPVFDGLVDVVVGSKNEGRDGGTHYTHM